MKYRHSCPMTTAKIPNGSSSAPRYAGILSRHSLYATNTTGIWWRKLPALKVHCFLSLRPWRQPADWRPDRLIMSSILVFVFQRIPATRRWPAKSATSPAVCDQNNVPFASNIATAEMLVLGLARGDLDWRMIVNPHQQPPHRLTNCRKTAMIPSVDV